MDSVSSLHLGDLVYLNLNDNTLLVDLEDSLPYFVKSVEKKKNVFRTCLFQLLSASPDPIASIVTWSTKHDITIKSSTPVILYNIESKRILSISKDSSKESGYRLILVDKITDQSIFQLSHPENTGYQGEVIQYQMPIQIQGKSTGQYFAVGTQAPDRNRKEFASVPYYQDNFPMLFPRQDTKEVDAERFTVDLGSQTTSLNFTQFQSSQSIRQDSKKILNGDFIRIRSLDKWLAHYPGQENKEEVYFEKVNDPFQQYNWVHSVFQVLSDDFSQASALETGNEKKYYLKHYLTGKIIHFSQPADVVALDKFTESETETPYFYFEREGRNTIEEKDLLKLQYFNDQGYETCLKVAELQPVKQVQFEINTVYYFGFKIPEEYAYKNQKNLIRHRAGISTEFEVETNKIILEKIQPEELKLIFKIEEFSEELLRFSTHSLIQDDISNEQHQSKLKPMIEKLLKVCREISQLLLLRGEDTREKQLGITVPQYNFKVPDRRVQNLIREFRIFDLIHYLNFAFISSAPGWLGSDASTEGRLLLELYEEFKNILINSLDENPMNRFYNSQFVRIYINTMADYCEGGVNKAYPQGVHQMKRITLDLLKVLFWENDLDALGQINYYISVINESIERDTSYQTYYLELMEHISQVKASNFVNTIRDTFIQEFIIGEEIKSSVFPKITFKNEELFIQFNKKDVLEIPFSILPLNVPASEYLIAVFKLLVALTSCNSTAFYHIIIKNYPINVLNGILQSEAPFEIKMLTHLLILSVHNRYIKPTLTSLPYAIQTNIQAIRFQLQEEEKKLRNSGDELIGELENEILEGENIRAEVQKIQNFMKDGNTTHLFNLLDKAINSHPNAQQTQIIILYIETILSQDTLDREVLNLIKKGLKNLLDACLKNADLDLALLPKILQAWKVLLKKTEVQLIISISQQVQSQNKDTESICKELISDYKTELLTTLAPFDEIALNEPRISNLVLPLLNDICSLEKNIVSELEKFIIISSPQEFSKIQAVLEITRELHKYSRIYSIMKERDGQLTLEGNEYLELLRLLERLFTTIYDCSKHHFRKRANRNKGLSPTELEAFNAKFIEDFRKQKAPTRDNPLVVDPNAVSYSLQTVYYLLSIPDTLLVLLDNALTLQLANPVENCPDQNYLVRIILVILIAFVYKNKRNQDFLSTNPNLIKKYYDQNFLNTSTDTLTLFAEILRDNKDLLQLSQKFIYDITCYTFIGTIKPRTLQTGGTYLCGTFLAMHYLHQAQLPSSVYESFETIESKFKEILSTEFLNIDLLVAHFGMAADLPDVVIEPSYVYYCLREALANSVQVLKQVKLEGKEKQITEFRNNFSCHKLLEALNRPGINFLFEIKNYLLKFFNEMHLAKNNVNSNFLNLEDLPSALKILVYLSSDLFEFLKFSPENTQKEATEKSYESFLATVKKMEGNTVDEDLNSKISEIKEAYHNFTKENILKRKIQIYLNQLPIYDLWRDCYIYDNCWKTLTKFCVSYPEIVQLSGLFENFLAITMHLIESTEKSNLDVFKMFKKYLTALESLPEYSSFKSKIQGLIQQASLHLDVFSGQFQGQEGHAKEIYQNANLINFINSLRAHSQSDLDKTMTLFSDIVRTHKNRKNILSQLLTHLSLNPFNLPKEMISFLIYLLNGYLKSVIQNKGELEKTGEFEKIQKEHTDLDFERRLVESFLITKDLQNVGELFSLILGSATGFGLKSLQNTHQKLYSLQQKLEPHHDESMKYEDQVEFILKKLLLNAEKEGDKESSIALKYCCESHHSHMSATNDEFRGFTSLPSDEQVTELHTILQNITQEDLAGNNLLKKLGPLPVCRETIQEIFRIQADDNNLVKKIKQSFQQNLKSSDLEGHLLDYFKTRIEKDYENTEQLKLESVLILSLFTKISIQT